MEVLFAGQQLAGPWQKKAQRKKKRRRTKTAAAAEEEGWRWGSLSSRDVDGQGDQPAIRETCLWL
jgi:hypothetical protein